MSMCKRQLSFAYGKQSCLIQTQLPLDVAKPTAAPGLCENKNPLWDG